MELKRKNLGLLKTERFYPHRDYGILQKATVKYDYRIVNVFLDKKHVRHIFSRKNDSLPKKKNTSHPHFQHIPLSPISSYTNGFHPSSWIHLKRREVYYNRKSIESIARATRPQAQKQQQCI